MPIDIATLEFQIKKILIDSQDMELSIDDMPFISKWLENWLKNKSFFIEKFGGLVYEFPEEVSFELSNKEKESKFNTFCEKFYFYFDKSFYWFLSEQKDSFYSNITSNDYYLKSQDITIKKGTKISKAVKYFFSKEEQIKQIQNEISQIIQNDKISGKLCFSVHPLDFLSSSENIYNWRSCHSLDGDYRAGNVSYMQDNSTIICYLKGQENCALPNFPFDKSVLWNSKKWRSLLFFSEDKSTVFLGRQYPFVNDSSFSFIKTFLDNIMSNGSGWEDFKTFPLIPSTVFSSEFESFGSNSLEMPDGKTYSASAIIHDNSKFHFDDLLYSSCYKPKYTTLKNLNLETFSPMTEIGHDIICPQCGNLLKEDQKASFFCRDCLINYSDIIGKGIYICDCCGKRVKEEDTERIDDTYVCFDCLETETAKCDCCNQRFFKQSNEILILEDNTKLCVYCDRNKKLRRLYQSKFF